MSQETGIEAYAEPASAGPYDFHALDHPYAGLVVEGIDAESAEQRAELLEWLRSRHLPRRLAGSPAAMVAIFRPTPLPLDRMSYVQVEGVDIRLTLLWFLQTDLRECWTEYCTDLDVSVTESGWREWSWWPRSSRRRRGRAGMWISSADTATRAKRPANRRKRPTSLEEYSPLG